MASKSEKRKYVILGIILAIAFLAGFYILYYDPSQKDITAMRQEIEAKDKELQTVQMPVALFEPLKKKVAELEEQLDKYRAKIATKAEVISLIKTIEEEAQRLDMKVVNMHTNVVEPPPQTEEKKLEGEESAPIQTTAYTKVIMDANLLGRFSKLEDLLKTLQDMETFVVVEKLDISSGGKTYPLLTSNIEINVYSEKGVDKSVIDK